MNAAAENRPPSLGGVPRFPRSGRLLRHADFERVYKQGRRHFSSHLTAFYFHRGDDGGWRVGFTVSRALGGAVERNRMKRRLRESVRCCWPQVSLPVDMVVNPKRSVLKADFAELVAELERAFNVVVRKLASRSDGAN